MFTPKQLLIKCITLLCLEHRDGVKTSPSNELISQVMQSLPIPEASVDHDHSRQTFLELRDAAVWLNSRTTDNFPSEMEVLQQAQVACREEISLYNSLQDAVKEKHKDVKETVKAIQSFRSNLQQYLNEEKIVSVLKDYSHRLVFKRNAIGNLVDEVVELGNQLEPLIQARTKQKHPALMGSMDFSEVKELEQHMTDVKVTISTDGAFKLGWKGLNRALGTNGVIKRGEFVLIGGLQHNFKTGMMLSLFTHIALFNKPFLRDKTRKPLLYFISFENEIPDNLLWIYKYLKENESGEAVIDSKIKVDEAAKYVSERLTASGFHVKMDRFDPTDFTAASLVGTLDALYAEGYEIQGLFLDYLNMVSKAGIDAKVAGDDIRLLFRRIRNYTASRGITCISPHQLSSDALQLTRENVEDFVKLVANKGYYDGCRRLGQEPDLELFIHIVKVNGSSYLTIQRGKHRNAVTPDKDQYVVLPFQPIGTIPWDVDKDHEVTLAMPGGGPLGSGQEIAWWGD